MTIPQQGTVKLTKWREGKDRYTGKGSGQSLKERRGKVGKYSTSDLRSYCDLLWDIIKHHVHPAFLFMKGTLSVFQLVRIEKYTLEAYFQTPYIFFVHACMLDCVTRIVTIDKLPIHSGSFILFFNM